MLREREDAQAALREKETTLQLAMEQLPVVLWATDRDLNLTLSMGSGLGKMGQNPGQYTGVSLSEYFHTDDPEFLPHIAHRKALLGESVHFEVDWAGRSFASYVEPLRAPDGAIAGVLGIALDVTPQKTAERERERSLALLRATLDSIDDGILVVDEKGVITLSNRRFHEMWRIPEGVARSADHPEFLARVLEPLKDPGGFAKRLTGVLETRETEAPGLVELKDGRVFERDSRPQRIGGETVGRVWSFRDVTQRIVVEQELDRSVSLLKAALDATADGILVVDRAGKIVSFNLRFVDMWRLPGKDRRLARRQQSPGVRARPAEGPGEVSEKSARALRPRRRAELRLARVQGWALFERYSGPQRVGGSIVGRVWSFRDVSDRRRMEEILRRQARTFEHIFDAVIVMDLAGNILDWNPGAEKMFGRPRQELLGTVPAVESAAQPGTRAPQMIAQMRKAGRWSGEVRFALPEGMNGIAQTVVVPLWDDYGRTVAALQVNRDVSELRRLEATRKGPEGTARAERA